MLNPHPDNHDYNKDNFYVKYVYDKNGNLIPMANERGNQIGNHTKKHKTQKKSLPKIKGFPSREFSRDISIRSGNGKNPV